MRASDGQIMQAGRRDAFPMVTSVRVRRCWRRSARSSTNLALAIRGASAVTLISAILVLGGALAAGHRHRVYDAVILKTLGATRLRLLGAYALEYLLIGLATAVFGVHRRQHRGLVIVTRLMTLTLRLAGRQRGRRGRWPPWSSPSGSGSSARCWRSNKKPATVLRNL